MRNQKRKGENRQEEDSDNESKKTEIEMKQLLFVLSVDLSEPTRNMEVPAGMAVRSSRHTSPLPKQVRTRMSNGSLTQTKTTKQLEYFFYIFIVITN